MGGIVGIFNSENAHERIFKALRQMQMELSSLGEQIFFIFSEDSEIRCENLEELKRVVREYDDLIACCVPKSREGDFKRLKRFFNSLGIQRVVADAEIFNFDEIESMRMSEGRILDALEGAYAICLWHSDGKVQLLRDIFGLRPIYFAHFDDCFAFSSHRNAMSAMGFHFSFELEPRTLLNYKNGRLKFASYLCECEGEEAEAAKDLKGRLLSLLRESLSTITSEDFGILFSGGLDSTLLAFLCKELRRKFRCYTAVFSEAEEASEASGASGVKGAKEAKQAEDFVYASRVARELGLDLRVIEVKIDEVEGYLKEIVPLVGADVVKVGVALPIFIACERAVADGIRTLIYGLGSEELFGGYERHKRAFQAGKLREACISGVKSMFRRDTCRDLAIARKLGVSLRSPFLTKKVANFAFSLPDALKVRKKDAEFQEKVILREIAADLGLKIVAERKKRAAQYGSKFHKAIEKLAKMRGFKRKREYLRQFHPEAKMRLGCLFSGGKDSTLALQAMLEAGFIVDCLLTVRSENPAAMLFHTPAVEITDLQADAIGLPLLSYETSGRSEAEELADLHAALEDARREFQIEGVVAGALWSEYQRRRIERICKELRLKAFFPLWHLNQETAMRIAVRNFDFILTGIAAYGLDKTWLGRRISDEDVDRLVEISEKWKINVAGEGGEFETLVLDAPFFRKRIVILASEIVEEGANTARLVVKNAKLEEKEAWELA
ncbi:MAG: Asparagine synthetase B [Methanophagales archaeon]|nr:diphthine--ammonia ligase [Methanophagales archaeon]MCU4140737.1 Asparagine synthetase B [Methanophagales archaeon]